MALPALATRVRDSLRRGLVIPAHPLALTSDRRLDERRQKALSRYYLAAGVGGLAVGVHTTQFAIHDPRVGLLRPVLELAVEEMCRHERQAGRTVVKTAGLCGPTIQAIREAVQAKDLGYDIGLLSLSALRAEPTAALISHARAVAEVMPIMGFYLQPAVGGRLLPVEFWRELAMIDNLAAIKIAPFNRYQTHDVVRAVAEAGRADQVVLYTGNDDHIIADLLTPFTFVRDGKSVTQRIVGGLLGHWAVWTRKAVEQLEAIHASDTRSNTIPVEWLRLNVEITDANGAFFDAANGFAGCIAGLHEVLRRQGLLAGRWCLDPHEELSEGQMAEIDRVYAAYPHLNDDRFVAAHRDEWLA
ncbi:MAG: dihydrodipicolinate synthase family protein [Phycisphaerae bacterium]|nr:dihydrodipicolinate synthase family protein [Phycisphaerae bacterium]